MITDEVKGYIIGETAVNHEGSIDHLYKMVDDISDIGLNAVKFHLLLNLESYMQGKHPLNEKVKKWLFTSSQWSDIIDYSNNKGLDVIALCDDVESLEFIIKNKKNVVAVEIHSSGLNDFFLLKKASEFDKLIILGIGGSTIDEIGYAVNLLKNNGKKDILLMYGFQSFPTQYSNINLLKAIGIKHLFNLPVGYADHTAFDDPNNEIISVTGAMMGLSTLEKHYTPLYGEKRIDYEAAVGKKQMLRIKELMEMALTVYGCGSLEMSKPEMAYGITGPNKKAIVAKKRIEEGEELTLDNLWFKRTIETTYLRQNQFSQLLGLKAIRAIEKDEIVDFSKVK